MNTETNETGDKRDNLNSLVRGTHYWIKYHGHWEVALYDGGGVHGWWLTAREDSTNPDDFDEVGDAVIHPSNGNR